MASNKFIFHQQNYCQDKSTLLILADSKSLFASHLEIWHYYSLGIIAVTYLMSPSTSISMLKYSILRIHLASLEMCNVWPHSPQVVFKADLHDFIPMVLVETSNSWEILPDIFVHDEPYKIFDLDLTNQVEFYLCSVVYHLPRYKTFLKYGCWLLSFQYCYIRLWVWIQLDEYLSFSWHNMSSFGN